MSKRRNLLALIGIVVLLLSLSVPVMQCAPVAEEEVTPPEEEEEEIKYGGRLNVGFRSEDMLENLTFSSTMEYSTMGCLFYPMVYGRLWLLDYPPDYEAAPSLATSWETPDGGKTWTFYLRDDVAWHDGVPFTAEDVAFTMEYLPEADPCWDYMDTRCEPGSIKVIDDYTVQFSLAESIGEIYPAVYAFPMLPKHIFEPHKDEIATFQNEEAIGCGAFKLKEFKRDAYIWFEVNEDYFEGRPYVDEVIWTAYGSDDALNMALKSGEIHMIGANGIGRMAASDFEGLENVEMTVSPGLTMSWAAFNLYKAGPLQDVNVRKAIMHGIDRDEIIEMVYLGYAEKIDGVIYPEKSEHNPNLPQYDYNVDKANVILDEGGYLDTDGDGIRNDPTTGKNFVFELLVSSAQTDTVKAATLCKEHLKGIGIDIVPQVVDPATYSAYIYAPTEGLFDIGFGGGGPGPCGDWIWEFFRSFESGGEGWNQAYYNNSEFDELLGKMYEATNPERTEYLYEMQEMVANDLPYGYLYRPSILDPVRTEFDGYVSMMGGISHWVAPYTYFDVHLR